MTTAEHLLALALQARVKAARSGDSRHQTIEAILRSAAKKETAGDYSGGLGWSGDYLYQR